MIASIESERYIRCYGKTLIFPVLQQLVLRLVVQLVNNYVNKFILLAMTRDEKKILLVNQGNLRPTIQIYTSAGKEVSNFVV